MNDVALKILAEIRRRGVFMAWMLNPDKLRCTADKALDALASLRKSGLIKAVGVGLCSSYEIAATEPSWSARYKQDCLILVRPEHEGRPAKQGAIELNGQVVILQGLWLMDDEDPYPGEWALGDVGVDGPLTQAGLGWIASGDVVPIKSEKEI